MEESEVEQIIEKAKVDRSTSLDLQNFQIVTLPENTGNLSDLETYRYWTKLSEWQSAWLLDEENTEIRRVLIANIGYEKICNDLGAIAIDTWQEYTLLRIDGIPAYEDDGMLTDEPMVLLKMTCPSTGHIHILRVPPEMTSAEAAITWINRGIHPDKFTIQT